MLIGQPGYRRQLPRIAQAEEHPVPPGKRFEESRGHVELDLPLLFAEVHQVPLVAADEIFPQVDPPYGPVTAAGRFRIGHGDQFLRLQDFRRRRDDHAGRHGGIGEAVDDDEAAAFAVLQVRVERCRSIKLQQANADLVQPEG